MQTNALTPYGFSCPLMLLAPASYFVYRELRWASRIRRRPQGILEGGPLYRKRPSAKVLHLVKSVLCIFHTPVKFETCSHPWIQHVIAIDYQLSLPERARTGEAASGRWKPSFFTLYCNPLPGSSLFPKTFFSRSQALRPIPPSRFGYRCWGSSKDHQEPSFVSSSLFRTRLVIFWLSAPILALVAERLPLLSSKSPTFFLCLGSSTFVHFLEMHTAVHLNVGTVIHRASMHTITRHEPLRDGSRNCGKYLADSAVFVHLDRGFGSSFEYRLLSEQQVEREPGESGHFRRSMSGLVAVPKSYYLFQFW